MPNKKSQWLETKKLFVGQKSGKALAKWLNHPDLNPESVEGLLLHAQFVFRWRAEYPSLHALNVARRKNKLPAQFWDSHQKLNETLATFTYVPQIDLDESPDGERVSWTLLVGDTPAIPPSQFRWVVQLIEQGAILKIRKCKQCSSWFFAHFSHQGFCKSSCRIKHFSGTEEFKKNRREYMRKYYKLQKFGNVK
jgi:hypothetical protein